MAKLRKIKLNSFIQFVKFVGELQENSKILWFRGCSNDKFQLIPSLYRHGSRSKIEEIASLESDLMTRFRQTSVPFHTKQLTDDWETLFFMQHYGIPTRLLDWTENPFIALFFAVMNAEVRRDKFKKLKYLSPVSVWILDPIKWNQCTSLNSVDRF